MNLANYLSQLENVDLVRRAHAADETYVFRHQLTQETAYHSLLNKTRRDIHQRVAETYEQLYADRLDEHASLLAFHYSEAGDDAKTFEYALRAADLAARKYAMAEALTMYARAREVSLRVAVPRDALIRLYSNRGDALENTGQHSQALENYDELERLGRERGDRALELAALQECITVHSAPTSKFDPPRARALAERAFQIAAELNDRAAEAKIAWNLMLLNGMAGNRAEMTRYGEKAILLARAENLREPLAYILGDMYRVHIANGDLPRGLDVLQEARGLWEELGYQNMIADTHASAALICFFAGRYAESVAHSEKALAVSQAIGNAWGQSFSRLVWGKIIYDHGDVRHAIATMEDCLRFGKEAGFIIAEIWTQSDFAFLYAEMGDPARGIHLAERAQAIAESKFPRWLSYAHGVLARAFLRLGDLARAESEIQAARKHSKPEEFVWAGEFVASMGEVEIALARNDAPRAHREIEIWLNRIEHYHFRAFLPEALLMQSRTFALEDHMDDARQALADAQREAGQIGTRRVLWQILAAQSEMEALRGNADAARALRSQAREHITFIADHAEDELRESFLNTEQVKRVFERI